MPKFNVLVTRDCTESTVVDVEAATEAQARKQAWREIMNGPGNFDWVVDDGSGHWSKPKITGCEEVTDAKA